MLGERCSEGKGEQASLPFAPSPCAALTFLAGLSALGGEGGVPTHIYTCWSSNYNGTSSHPLAQLSAGQPLAYHLSFSRASPPRHRGPVQGGGRTQPGILAPLRTLCNHSSSF